MCSRGRKGRDIQPPGSDRASQAGRREEIKLAAPILLIALIPSSPTGDSLRAPGTTPQEWRGIT